MNQELKSKHQAFDSADAPVFDAYAAYYDLLYKDKDYVAEAEYVNQLIKLFHPAANSILELGSGTGKHARLLAEKGYIVHGIERSPEMLAVARRDTVESGLKNAGLNDSKKKGEGNSLVSFSLGDIRTARVEGKFDCVISLFHVFSYLSTNEDLLAGLRTAHDHLKPGGILLFDFWYGPAVLTEKPVVRVKRMQEGPISVVRLCEPSLLSNQSLVDVHYHAYVRDSRTGTVQEIDETHRMRYLFLPELEFMAGSLDFLRLDAQEWMTGRTPGIATWGVCIVMRKKS